MAEPENRGQQKYMQDRSEKVVYPTFEAAQAAKDALAKKHRREKVKVKVRARKHGFKVLLLRRLGKPDPLPDEPAPA